MMNIWLDKIFSQLQVVYDNLLKSLKMLKKFKTCFIDINNCHKMTRKIHEKEKIQKIDRTIRFHILK